MDEPLPQLRELTETRLLLLRGLADSLEVSRSALLSNDAEAIARGAAHQAELCRQWSELEAQIRACRTHRVTCDEWKSAQTSRNPNQETERLQQLESEWIELSARIRYLTRVHWSLLRHLNRSLTVLSRVVESCAPTYAPEPGALRLQARAGE